MTQTTPTYSTEAVLGGLRRGDEAAINSFYARLKTRAFRTFCRHPRGSREHQAMEDCFNEAFLTLLQKVRAGHCQEGKLMNFALGIVHNCYRDTLKKRRRHWWPELSPGLEPAAEEAPAQFRSAAQLFAANGHFQLLHWYRHLPRLSRLILDLRVQGYNNKEIAGLLPLTHGVVRNRYSALLREAKRMAG